MPAALVLVGITGLLVAALAAYASVSFRHSTAVRQRSELRFSAQAGMDVVVDQLRNAQSLCAYTDDTTPEPVAVPVSPNGSTLTAECTFAGGTPQGMNGIAAVITGVGPSTLVQDGGPASVAGSVYLADSTGLAATGLELRGDLWFYGADCSAPAPAFSGVTFTPSSRRGPRCTSTEWTELVPAVTTPDAPVVTDPPARDDVIPPDTNGDVCRVFEPGRYTGPPQLGEHNYFASGIYVFDFDEPLVIGDATVIAGQPAPDLGDPGAIVDSPCAGALPELQLYEQGHGVTLFLSGNARVEVGAGGELEIFGRREDPPTAPTAATPTVAVAAVPDGAADLRPSAISTDGPPILATDVDSTVVIHGDLQAPSGPVELRGATAQVRGSVVAGRLHLGAPSSGQPVITTTSVPLLTTMSVVTRATDAGGQFGEVHAVVDYEAADTASATEAAVAIRSWRVS